MMFTQVALVALAGAAVALPTRSERLAARRARRALARGSAHGRTLTPQNPRVITTNGTVHNTLDSNWAGPVISKSNAGWNAVSATINVPTASTPSGGSRNTVYGGSAWVGIDGDTCQTAIWQAGFDWEVQGSTVQYDAWYEWYPAVSEDTSLAVSAGDSITISLTASSKTKGSVTITNNTTGKKVSQTVTAQGGDLCQQDAEWILEDFAECENSSCSQYELIPFAKFSTVTFSGTSATGSSGTSTASAYTTLFDIESSSGVRETTSSVSGSTVTVKYDSSG